MIKLQKGLFLVCSRTLDVNPRGEATGPDRGQRQD